MNSDGVQTAKGWGANGLLQMSLKGGAIREGWGVIGLCKSGGVQDWALCLGLLLGPRMVGLLLACSTFN